MLKYNQKIGDEMKKFLYGVVFIVSLCVFAFSGWKIYDILSNRHIAKEHYKSYDEFVVVEPQKTEPTEKDKNKSKKNNVKCDIKIDFKKLQTQYPNAVGWIYMKDTVINYPVMQTTNNSYYLTRLPDKTINSSGAIYADFRNTLPTAEDNYIIYGHNMKNGTMFGVLNKFRYADFYKNHSEFYYLTPKKTYRINVIAGCDVPYNGDIYITDFTKADKDRLVKSLINKSAFTPNKQYKSSDKLMTLSTCSNNSSNTRFVIVGTIQE